MVQDRRLVEYASSLNITLAQKEQTINGKSSKRMSKTIDLTGIVVAAL